MSETAPLTSHVSLRFPDVPSEPTEGAFDGNSLPNSSFSYITRSKNSESLIPQPLQKEGVESEWRSVLQKRQPIYSILRCLLCNCCCNPDWNLTRAQIIWFCNFLCAIVHIFWCYQCLSVGLPKGDKMNAEVWRLAPRWNSTSADGYTASLVSNGKPIRIDLVAGGFFGLSALFHTFVVLIGPFDRFIWIYWRQLDLAFFWWRWCAAAHCPARRLRLADSRPTFAGWSTRCRRRS